MKPVIFLTMSIVASSKISTTPARSIPQTNHRWRCSRCNQVAETEVYLPPANYNCPSPEEIHAWENIDFTDPEKIRQ